MTTKKVPVVFTPEIGDILEIRYAGKVDTYMVLNILSKPAPGIFHMKVWVLLEESKNVMLRNAMRTYQFDLRVHRDSDGATTQLIGRVQWE